LLFTLYLLDFKRVLRSCKYSFYADDFATHLHTKPRSFSQAIFIINSDVFNIIDWNAGSNLKLNVSKTTVMIMSTTRYINMLYLDALPRITVNGTDIPCKNSVNYLGLTISSTLSWDKQVAKTSRVYASLHPLNLCRHLLPLGLRQQLISFLILPIFDYCCTALTDITSEQNLRLHKSLNARI